MVTCTAVCEKIYQREVLLANFSTSLSPGQGWAHHKSQLSNLSMFCDFHPLSTIPQKKIAHDTSLEALYQFYQGLGRSSWIFWQMDGYLEPFSYNLLVQEILDVVWEDCPKWCSEGHG